MIFFFQAEDGIRDYKVTGVRRVLFRSSAVSRGRRRVNRAAKGLQRVGVRPDQILHSGLLRARETAELVAAALGVPRACRSEERRVGEGWSSSGGGEA